MISAMPRGVRSLYILGTLFLITAFYFFSYPSGREIYRQSNRDFTRPAPNPDRLQWSRRKENNPVRSFLSPPRGPPLQIPKIQYEFPAKSTLSYEGKKLLRERKFIVKKTFQHSWKGYRDHAWMKDELSPLSGGSRLRVGGWAATLVDSLDTLWVMGLKTEFAEAVNAVSKIDFTTSEEEEINIFETTIRYLGGLLSAFDLSGAEYPVLLEKAVELGDFLYAAFDTPNRMPVTRWKWRKATTGEQQEASEGTLLAELGSLCFEFTRLYQLSGMTKFYDATQRITNLLEKHQSLTQMPGLWPVLVNPKTEDFTGYPEFTLGSMADSAYESLPKLYLQLGGLSLQPRKMYEIAIKMAKERTFFRPMSQDNKDILMTSTIKVTAPGEWSLDPQIQHLSCYVGGMMAVGSRIFGIDEDLKIARRLVDGCIWSYDITATGLMPESFHVIPCPEINQKCPWDAKHWQADIITRNDGINTDTFQNKTRDLGLKPGITNYSDRKYILRQEAIESIFVLYRITGDENLREAAWRIFSNIDRATRTQHGNAALDDVTKVPPPKSDSMATFWTGATLKYFYLIFSDPGLLSLDEWTFSTEGHPFRRPK